MGETLQAERVYKVTTPIVTSSGGRKGYNQFVTDVNELADHIGGERIDGQIATEMRHGDLLLTVRPSGFAKDRHSFISTLFAAIDGRLHLLMSVDWPEKRRSIIRRIIAYRQSGAEKIEAEGRDATLAGTVESRLRAAINDAMDAGLTNQQIIKVALQCDAARRSQPAKRLDESAAVA